MYARGMDALLLSEAGHFRDTSRTALRRVCESFFLRNDALCTSYREATVHASSRRLPPPNQTLRLVEQPMPGGERTQRATRFGTSPACRLHRHLAQAVFRCDVLRCGRYSVVLRGAAWRVALPRGPTAPRHARPLTSRVTNAAHTARVVRLVSRCARIAPRRISPQGTPSVHTAPHAIPFTVPPFPWQLPKRGFKFRQSYSGCGS